MTWVYDDVLKQIEMTNNNSIKIKMTIISKCGKEAGLPKFGDDPRVAEFVIMILPNVGGCDYAYAHFINHYVETATPEDAASSVIMFIKDTPRTKKHFHFGRHAGFRPVTEMLEIASGGGFICGIKPMCRISTFHDTAVLYSFIIGSYMRQTEQKRLGLGKNDKQDIKPEFNPNGYSNLRDFHERALNWTFPNEHVTQVCYGGAFAVPASRIITLAKEPRTRQVMMNFEEILSRNVTTSIEEHFTERTWAGLLANPLEKEDTDIILGMKHTNGGGIFYDQGSVMGALMGDTTCKYGKVI